MTDAWTAPDAAPAPDQPGWEARHATTWDHQEPAPTWAPAAGVSWPDPAPPDPAPPDPAAGPTEAAPAVPPPATAPASREEALARRSAPAHAAPSRLPGGRAEPLRPSRLPYRVGVLRRTRATVALLVLTAVAGLVVAAVALAVVAGLAAAISSASS